VLAVNPVIAEYREYQAIGFDRDTAVGHWHARDAHLAIGDQFAAPLACAKTLRLQDAV
jgi:hypothetical protein